MERPLLEVLGDLLQEVEDLRGLPGEVGVWLAFVHVPSLALRPGRVAQRATEREGGAGASRRPRLCSFGCSSRTQGIQRIVQALL